MDEGFFEDHAFWSDNYNEKPAIMIPLGQAANFSVDRKGCYSDWAPSLRSSSAPAA